MGALRFMVFICVLTCQNWALARSPSKNPVLLIPGVGGTLLQVPSQSKDVWISFDSFMASLPAVAWSTFPLPPGPFIDTADNDFREFALGMYNGSGEIASLWSKNSITVPYALNRSDPKGHCRFNAKSGGICGIQYVADFLETPWPGPTNFTLDLFTQFASFNNYAALISYLELNHGLVPGKDLFGFPYDWRHSVRRPAMLFRLDQTLKTISKDGAQPVSIFSHSMGCLIVKLYIDTYKSHAEKYIRNWIAVGGPFQGAGGELLSSFFNGYMIGNISVCDCTSRQLAVQSPAIMEMMPDDKSLMTPLQFHIRTPQSRQTILGTESILDIVEQAYQTHTFNYGSKKYNWPLSRDARRWARDTREQLLKATPSNKIKIYAVYGDEVDTPYDGQINVKNDYQLPDLLCEKAGCPKNSCSSSSDECALNFRYRKGDGKVPTESAANPYGIASYPMIKRVSAGNVEHQNLIKPISGMYEQYSLWFGLSD